MTKCAGRTRCGAIRIQISRSVKCRARTGKRPAFEHRKIAPDQSAAGGGCRAAKIPLLDQNDPQATPGGIARHADAIQPAADNRKIVVRHTLIYPLMG